MVVDAFKEAKVPVDDYGVECESMEQIGELTYIISGKEYKMKADEWLREEYFPGSVNAGLA